MTPFDQIDRWGDRSIDLKSPYLTTHLITYLGNKRSLLPLLKDGFDKVRGELHNPKMVCLDGFSGSGCVSRLLKNYASVLHSNDLEPYTETINKCYLTYISDVNMTEIRKQIELLNQHKLCKSRGIIESLYSPKDDTNIQNGERVFYTNQNAKIIDDARQRIEKLPTKLQPFCLAPLLVKASIHVNTSGVFKGFHKNRMGIGQFGGESKVALQRICQEIVLEVPILSDVNCEVNVHRKDINKLVKDLPDVDLAYYDPPYNQHPYGSNYFMLNVINSYEKPEEISSVSGIPKSWNKSDYNKRVIAEQAMENLIDETPAKFILISYNNEGIIPLSNFASLLKKFGSVELMTQEYNTYRGSRNLRDRSIKTQEFLWILKKGKSQKYNKELQRKLDEILNKDNEEKGFSLMDSVLVDDGETFGD